VINSSKQERNEKLLTPKALKELIYL
jgi:hypothetical protein